MGNDSPQMTYREARRGGVCDINILFLLKVAIYKIFFILHFNTTNPNFGQLRHTLGFLLLYPETNTNRSIYTLLALISKLD